MELVFGSSFELSCASESDRRIEISTGNGYGKISWTLLQFNACDNVITVCLSAAHCNRISLWYGPMTPDIAQRTAVMMMYHRLLTKIHPSHRHDDLVVGAICGYFRKYLACCDGTRHTFNCREGKWWFPMFGCIFFPIHVVTDIQWTWI